MAEEPLITTGEVARRIGVTSTTVGRWVQQGKLVPDVVTPGGRYRWRWSNVQRQLNEQRKRDG